MEILSIQDYLSSFFALILIYTVSFFYSKKICSFNLKRFFFIGLTLRLLSSYLTAFLYVYYYGYGDSLEYFKGASLIIDTLYSGNFEIFFELVFGDNNSYSSETLIKIQDQHYFFGTSTHTTCSIAGIIGILFFGSFLSISLIFSFFSFIGSWLIYLSFSKMYPILTNKLAYSTLFIPSVFFWGSGVMKDPLCIFGLGCIILFIFKLVYFKKVNFVSIILATIGAFLLINLKAYILICFSISISTLWYKVFLRKFNKQRGIKLFFKIGLPIISILLVYSLLSSFGNLFLQYSFENLIISINKFQQAQLINTDMEGGSGYDLGDVGTDFLSIILYIFQVLNVALFRPYIWEISKLINIPMALESLVLLFFSLKLFIKYSFIEIIRTVYKNEIVSFCILFVLLLSFVVGIISYNFGTLARYRIPTLPFYFIAFSIISLELNIKKANTSSV